MAIASADMYNAGLAGCVGGLVTNRSNIGSIDATLVTECQDFAAALDAAYTGATALSTAEASLMVSVANGYFVGKSSAGTTDDADICMSIYNDLVGSLA
jgi:hypothetical protein